MANGGGRAGGRAATMENRVAGERHRGLFVPNSSFSRGVVQGPRARARAYYDRRPRRKVCAVLEFFFRLLSLAVHLAYFYLNSRVRGDSFIIKLTIINRLRRRGSATFSSTRAVFFLFFRLFSSRAALNLK